MNMTLQSSIKDKILVAQKETFNESMRLQRGLDKMVEVRRDEVLYYLDRIWVHLKRNMRTLIMDEAHKSKYYLHLGADKMTRFRIPPNLDDGNSTSLKALAVLDQPNTS
nr:putative reverse transcriptase domain-containing protein [Tanacetum cinerariifolium]